MPKMQKGVSVYEFRRLLLLSPSLTQADSSLLMLNGGTDFFLNMEIQIQIQIQRKTADQISPFTINKYKRKIAASVSEGKENHNPI